MIIVNFYLPDVCFLGTKKRKIEIIKRPTGITMSQGILLSGAIPVFGSFGAATTTVAIAISLAVRPFALPAAVAVFVVV